MVVALFLGNVGGDNFFGVISVVTNWGWWLSFGSVCDG